MLNDFILFLTKGSEKVTYLYVSGVTGDEWYQLCDLLSKAPVSSPTGARWERTQPKPCCRAHRASPPILNLRRVWVLLRSPLQGQRGRGFVRNQTRCHQKAQFQSAICQAIFGYVKPFFPQDSCYKPGARGHSKEWIFRVMSCLALSSVTTRVDSGRNCIFLVTSASGSFRGEKKAPERRQCLPPAELLSSGSLKPLRSQPLALTCQTASFNSPFTLLIKNKKCHSL